MHNLSEYVVEKLRINKNTEFCDIDDNVDLFKKLKKVKSINLIDVFKEWVKGKGKVKAYATSKKMVEIYFNDTEDPRIIANFNLGLNALKQAVIEKTIRMGGSNSLRYNYGDNYFTINDILQFPTGRKSLKPQEHMIVFTDETIK